MKLLPYWRGYCSGDMPCGVTPVKYAYKPNKPPRTKAVAGTGGFKLKHKHK